MAAVTAMISNILNIVTHHFNFFSNNNCSINNYKYEVCDILGFLSLYMQKSCKKMGSLITSIYFKGLTRFEGGHHRLLWKKLHCGYYGFYIRTSSQPVQPFA